MPHSPEHPEPWPEIDAVTDIVTLDWLHSGQTPPGYKVGHWLACYTTELVQTGETCLGVTNVTRNEDLSWTGQLMMIRHGSEASTMKLQGVAFPLNMYSGLPPIRSEFSNIEPWSESKEYVVPEAGLSVMLMVGILGLWVAGWRRKKRSRA